MASPTPVIIDCDPGTDDAIALLLALASPELDIRAVTVCAGNVGLEQTLRNALSLMKLAGSSVPVYRGAERPLLGSLITAAHVHGEDGLGGVRLPPGDAPAPGIAADAIRSILRAATRPVTLIGLAPATNLALALMPQPSLIERIERIVLMSGAWGEGNATPAAEFNARCDPEALALLLSCGRPVVLATLEVTAQALATPTLLADWESRGAGRCLQAACGIQRSVPLSRRHDRKGAPLHDPCAVAYAIDPTLFTTRHCAVEVDISAGPSRGRTLIDRWGITGHHTNAVLLETLATPRFFEMAAERLARLP